MVKKKRRSADAMLTSPLTVSIDEGSTVDIIVTGVSIGAGIVAAELLKEMSEDLARLSGRISARKHHEAGFESMRRLTSLRGCHRSFMKRTFFSSAIGLQWLRNWFVTCWA